MRFRPALATIALVMPISCGAQAVEPVSEDIHSEGNGDADVCGLTAGSVADLERQIQARQDVEMLDRTAEYNAYAIDDRRVLTFTSPQNRAHPAVACRQVVPKADGGSTIQTSVACFNNRENCDWLYREFADLTKRTIDAMEGKQ